MSDVAHTAKTTCDKQRARYDCAVQVSHGPHGHGARDSGRAASDVIPVVYDQSVPLFNCAICAQGCRRESKKESQSRSLERTGRREPQGRRAAPTASRSMRDCVNREGGIAMGELGQLRNTGDTDSIDSCRTATIRN